MSRHEQYPLPQHSTMYNGTHAAIMESPNRFKKCMDAKHKQCEWGWSGCSVGEAAVAPSSAATAP